MKIPLVSCLVMASLSLWACGSRGLQPTPEVVEPAPSVSTTGGTSLARSQGGCYYVWTSQALPAASKTVESALQAISPRITGTAYAYGEDCVSPDGAHAFTPMETDFHVRVYVTDLQDETKLGISIGQVMDAIAEIPSDEFVGARSGRVDFEFYVSDTEDLNLTVGIEKYRQLAPGTSGADLFRLFRTGP